MRSNCINFFNAMTSNLVKSFHITTHAIDQLGKELTLSEHRGGELSDKELQEIARRAKAAIKAAWPDWVPKQEPYVRMNWLHKNSIIIP